MPARLPTLVEWLTIAAIILGPVLALLAQRVLDFIREKKKQRVNLFLTLMATRLSPLAPAHVQALNSIDVVFSRRGDQKIRDAWRKVLDQINVDPNTAGWLDKLNDLKVDLYQVMGARVGYTFTTDYLKRQAYLPRHYTDTETDAIHIRQTLAKILTDEGLKVRVVTEPASAAAPPAPHPPAP